MTTTDQSPSTQVFTHIGHDDHGVSPEQISFVMSHPDLLAREDGSFIIELLTLPEELGTVPSALYGPLAGDGVFGEDKVFYEARGNRRGPSRLTSAGDRPARNIVAIGLKGGPCFTMYGTQANTPSPKEPWDAANEEELAKCLEFWNQHCLAEAKPKPEAAAENLPTTYRTPIHFGAEDGSV